MEDIKIGQIANQMFMEKIIQLIQRKKDRNKEKKKNKKEKGV